MIRARSFASIPMAGIDHRHLDSAVDRAPPDGEPAPLRHRVARVADQVAEGDPELIAVAQDVGKLGERLERDFDLVARRVDLERLAHQRLDGDRAACRAPASARSSTRPR